MSKQRPTRDPADRKPSIAITLYPWVAHSVVTVDVSAHDSTGRHISRLAYWHLDLTRAQLAGRSTDDVLRLLCERILRRLESGPVDPGDKVAGRTDNTAAGPGAPLGATGGTVTQDCLPGI